MQEKFQEQQKLDSEQSSINSMSSITAGLPVTTTQDLPHQPATPSSIDPFSNVNSSSAIVVTTRARISSCKRGQTSAQSYSSQKTKRQRVWRMTFYLLRTTFLPRFSLRSACTKRRFFFLLIPVDGIPFSFDFPPINVVVSEVDHTISVRKESPSFLYPRKSVRNFFFSFCYLTVFQLLSLVVLIYVNLNNPDVRHTPFFANINGTARNIASYE